MQDINGFYIVIGFLGLGWLAVYLLNAYRRKKVREVAEEMGLAFTPKIDLRSELAGCELLNNKGHGNKFYNCFGGEADGISFMVFEYLFYIGHGKRKQTHLQTVTYIKAEQLQLPNFLIQPKSLFGKLLGSSLINEFKINEEFSKKFNCSSTEPIKARSLISESVQEMIRDNKWTVESNRDRLLIYRSRSTVALKKLKEFLSDSIAVMMELEGASLDGPAATTNPVSLAESQVEVEC